MGSPYVQDARSRAHSRPLGGDGLPALDDERSSRCGRGGRPEARQSVGGELRYQRYLSTPSFVAADPSGANRVSAAAGIRAHVELGGGRVVRPGLAYSRGLDDPMRDRSYHVVQIDVPLSF